LMPPSFPQSLLDKFMDFLQKATSMERRWLDDSLRYALVNGKRALENAGLGGDNLNKVRSCANVFFRCAGYSTNSLQNILLDFAWSTSMSSGDGDRRIMAFSSGCEVVGHYHRCCCWRSLNMCVTFVIVQTAPEPFLFSI
jgi:hypothetical protein